MYHTNLNTPIQNSINNIMAAYEPPECQCCMETMDLMPCKDCGELHCMGHLNTNGLCECCEEERVANILDDSDWVGILKRYMSS